MNLPEPPHPGLRLPHPPGEESRPLAKQSIAARNGIIATVVTFFGLMLLSGAKSAESGPADTPVKDSGGTHSGLPTQDVYGDILVGACNTGFGLLRCDVTIVNSSGGRADYDIRATIENSSGAKVGTARTMVTGVEGGQTTKDELIGTFTGRGKKLTLLLKKVQRIAS
jgi:hypothetical protein